MKYTIFHSYLMLSSLLILFHQHRQHLENDDCVFAFKAKRDELYRPLQLAMLAYSSKKRILKREEKYL